MSSHIYLYHDGSRPGGVRRASGQSNPGQSYDRQQYDRIDATSQPNSYTSSPPVYLSGQSTANWTAGPLQREPPKEFRPQMLDPEPANRKPTPTAYPAELDRNSAILQGEESFKAFRRVDEHAMLVSQQQQDNFTQLIWQLIYARNITSDLERVRAIFLWLCTKDLHKMNFDNVKPDSPEEILMGIRTGKSTYAQIFLTLCRYANLHCKLILGYAKGADYSPGMRFTGSVGQHSWNAVLIDGTWRLVDCHWAARRLIVKRASVENIRYVLDTFYFLANPSQLIYTHFPHDTDWQLLHHPVTLEEFESLALVKSAFFKYNLSLLSYRNAVIVFTDPEIRIVVGFPPGSENFLSFTLGLTFDDQDFTEHYNSVPLIRYARQEVLEKESCVAFYVRPPRPGAYKLLIYAKHKQGETAIASSDPPESTENLYGAVCEYRLMARVSHNVCLPPFPPCQTGNYGQTEMAKRFNIRAVCREPAVRAIQGTVELRFASTDPNRPLPRLMGQLKCALLYAEALDHCILQRTLSTESALLIFLPEAGEYGLEVYANDPARDGSSYFAIWQYLLTSDRASPVRGLPSLPPAYLGPGPKFSELGLSTVSHSDPFIRADTGELCVHLAFQQNLPLKLMAQLLFATNDASEDCSHMILQQTRMNQVYFLLRFPRTGFFKLQLYALPENDRNDSLPGVYNYLIEASECHRLRGQVMPFPQQFAHWRRGCYLETPTEGILGLEANGRLSSQPPDSLPFSVSIPNAFAVAVVVGDEWTQLDPKGDRWEGSIPMKGHWGIERKLAVCASYAANDVNYSTLLEYSLAL
uniref:Transglutaminase-like domain-containing protein n=1 Tax=Schistocephalus solidus TaxID=70667 RepID=A0A0V0J7E0_SCHSO